MDLAERFAIKVYKILCSIGPHQTLVCGIQFAAAHLEELD
jgi:hypothetical protein